MIELSNGHNFLFMAASGALGYTGEGWWWEQLLYRAKLIDPTLFTIVTKTVTLKSQKGRSPLLAVRPIKGGVVNALGLGNPGIKEIIKRIKNTKLNLVISIAGTTYELLEMTRILNDLDNIQGIEINVSCPNLKEDITTPYFTNKMIENCYLVSGATYHPIILKISPAQPYLKIAEAVENMGVEAFDINSVPWRVIYPDQKSPLQRFGGGGVSGQAAQPITWEVVEELSRATSIPVIGPSVWEYKDINTLLELGAMAISFGSIFLRYPSHPTRFVKQYYQEKQ